MNLTLSKKQFEALSILLLDDKFKARKSVSDREVYDNTLDLGSLCAGVAYSHVCERLKKPSQELSFPLPIGKIRKIPALGCEVHSFLHTWQYPERYRFLQAITSLQVKMVKTRKSLLPQSIDRLQNIQFLGALSLAKTKQTINLLKDLPNLLRKHAAKVSKRKIQLILLVAGKEKISHACSLQLYEPVHFLDPAFGILRFDSLEFLINSVPLYLTAQYSHYHKIMALQYEAIP